MPKIDLEQLKKSLTLPQFTDLRTYLRARLEELKDIDNVQEYSKAQDQAIELKAQKKAYKKLAKILSELLDLEDSAKQPVETEQGNDYGVE